MSNTAPQIDTKTLLIRKIRSKDFGSKEKPEAINLQSTWEIWEKRLGVVCNQNPHDNWAASVKRNPNLTRSAFDFEQSREHEIRSILTQQHAEATAPAVVIRSTLAEAISQQASKTADELESAERKTCEAYSFPYAPSPLVATLRSLASEYAGIATRKTTAGHDVRSPRTVLTPLLDL